ncbi:hypothetical protein CJ030_MR2G009200 [Morella rubra]|uniref:Major facilitator superfamily (MFS) profile domain-containing protein n=1 Tax=Morella rubra TaxID=262757 RepID=A0A6A1WJ06_9ROSI|nr:hypothetical protein CJ030_MR2G009200 [Morella rubra]
MAKSTTEDSASRLSSLNSWFTPKRLLMMFCLINLINYVDRGAIASNGVNGSLGTCTESGICTSGSGIQGDFNLNNFQDGVLSSAFMVGLFVASPIFASLAKSHNPFRLIGVGLSVWTFAVAGCASSFDFWSIAICRMLVGVGEASFISLAAPFIDDKAPAAQKTAWLATFYMCIPTGVALGYVYEWTRWCSNLWLDLIFASLAKSVIELGYLYGHSLYLVHLIFGPLQYAIRNFNMDVISQGEASFISLAAPFIDDKAPAAQKTAWLATFYMCIPTGVALGYVYGGLVGYYLNWRYAFFGEAFFMLPFAIWGFLMKPLELKGFAPVNSKEVSTNSKTVPHAMEDSKVSDSDSSVVLLDEGISAQAFNKASKSSEVFKILDEFSSFSKDLKVLLLDKVYVVNALGYIVYNFVLGAYSYWGPKAGYSIYHMNNADYFFGGITIVCGIFGTLSGGLILDHMNATISNAFKLLSGATLLGAIFCFSAFCLKSLYGFIALFAVGEMLVFAIQAPVNYICLHCVKPSLRPLSLAISTVSIHVFGDVPSSPLVGVLQDYVNNWRETALILTSVLFLAAGIWFIGIFLNSVDMYNEEGENEASTVEKASMKPLLGGKRNEVVNYSGEA